MAATQKLSLLLMIILLASVSGFAGVPPPCKRIECPSYDVVHVGAGYEVRFYNSTSWAGTEVFKDTSLVHATRRGFLRLFDYIQGKNGYNQKIEMTAPVIAETDLGTYGGLNCESSFEVSFYIPKKNQANPPPPTDDDDLVITRSKPVYAIVRQFSGFVRDNNVGEQVDALKASIAGTAWASAYEKSKRGGFGSYYCVAEYNAPFEFDDRVNEIWFLFDDLVNGKPPHYLMF